MANIETWMALQVSRRAESCPRVIPGAGIKLREVARRVNLYPWGLGVTFPPLGGSGARCAQCAAPLGAESDTALTGEPVCGKCAATIRAESDPPECPECGGVNLPRFHVVAWNTAKVCKDCAEVADHGPHHGQGHPALYD